MHARAIHIRSTALVFLGILAFAACRAGPQPQPSITEIPEATIPITVDMSEITVENYPVVDGSTSTIPLDTRIACHLLELKCAWMEMFDGTKLYMPDVTDLDETSFGSIFPPINHSGTHGSYVNLINGDSDLIFVARPPSQDELDLADSLGVDLVSHPIALDAFVFIVNKENPVDSLTLRQIQGIYTSAITTWDEVGGEEAPITPYQRNDNSGSQELMKSLVMKGLTMISAPDMMLPTMMAPINAISDDVLGIGYSVYFYEQFMAPNQKLKLLGVEGIVPNYKTIQSREYPLTTEVYAVVRTDLPEDSLAMRLRDWVLTEEGQAEVTESGYVALR